MEPHADIFREVDKALREKRGREGCFAQHVLFSADRDAAFRFDISLVGLHEKPVRRGHRSVFFSIREALYGFSGFSNALSIGDWGDLRVQPNAEESMETAREALQGIAKKSRLVLLLGDVHTLDVAQYQGMPIKPITWLSIDRVMDAEDPSLAGAAQKITQWNHEKFLLCQEENPPAHYIHMAHQRHMVATATVRTLQERRHEHFSLGRIRDSMEEAECRIRQADGISFDMCALEKRYVPAIAESSVFGLTAQEACQLSWYAGANEKTRNVGFYGYGGGEKDTAAVVATCLWYCAEAFSLRRGESAFEKYTKYHVVLEGYAEGLTFYRDPTSEKWWMKIREEAPTTWHNLLPCTPKDYEQATEGEISYRWLLLQKGTPLPSSED